MVTTRILGALVALAALTACSPSTSPSATASAPTGTPTPTFLCTPEAGGAEAPCTQDEYEQMKARDAEYAEAERVYRATWDLRIAAYRGEPHQDPADLAQGSALESLRADLAQGYQLESGELTVVRVTRLVGLSKEGSTVAVEGCVRVDEAVLTRGGEKVTLPAPYSLERMYFGVMEGALRAFHAETKSTNEC